MHLMSTNILFVSCALIIFNQIIPLTNSNNITCLNNGLCRGKPIICNDNEDCYLRCVETNSCYWSTVHCPRNAKCNIFCGVNRNSCDDIVINATHSTSLYVYCADNECDDATLYCPHNGPMGIDQQCVLKGNKVIDRIQFYTEEGFHDINIQNIQLTESIVYCGEYNAQFQCNINTAENGCITTADNTCESYRLPTISPTYQPSIAPSDKPTILPSRNPTQYQQSYYAMHSPTSKPTNAPIQIYNNENSRLEFYLFYNDSNGINMILGKWMKDALINTYNEFAATAATAATTTEWSNGGLLNMTFCAVFNVHYNNKELNKYCKRFKDYGYYNKNDGGSSNLNIANQFNTEYVAYGTFGIYSDAFINSFQLFVIDTFSSYLFKQSFNLNMNQLINTVGFDDIFEAITIIVQPFDPIKRESIKTTQNNGTSEEHIHIILGAIIGTLTLMTAIVCAYGMRYYYVMQRKKDKLKNGTEGEEGMSEKEQHSDTPIHAHEQTQLKLIPSIPASSVTTMNEQQMLDNNMNTNNNNNNNNNNTQNEPNDLLMAPGYYLGISPIGINGMNNKSQKGYLSTDDDSENTNDDDDDDDEKLHKIPRKKSLSDSNDNKSVISSIISFGRRRRSIHKSKHKNKNKHKKKRKNSKDYKQCKKREMRQHIEHKRAKTAELKQKKQAVPERKRSLHWGFTDDGVGENDDDKKINTCNSDACAQSLNALLHLKSQSAFTVQKYSFNSPDTIPELQYCNNSINSIKQLELARNSSYHSNNNKVSSSFTSNTTDATNNTKIFNSPMQSMQFNHISNKSQRLSIDEIEHDNTLNDEQFLAALSPSIKSIEDMYASPKSPDGVHRLTGQTVENNTNNSNNSILKKALSPIKNESNLDQQIEMNTYPVYPRIVNESNKRTQL